MIEISLHYATDFVDSLLLVLQNEINGIGYMSLTNQCNNCGSSVTIEPNWIGHEIGCPSCNVKFIVPITTINSGMVAGDFWFQKSLGSGEIGEIFVVKKVKEQERYLMKVLSPSVTQNLQVYNMFLNQVSQSMSVDHPNINVVREIGEVNKHRYLLSDYIEGESLKDFLDKHGPLKERFALKVLLKTARALQQTWDSFQQIHSNLKPTNILLDKRSDVFLLDFACGNQLYLTNDLVYQRPNYTGGEIADYMTPEHAQNLPLDLRSDIYSLGACFYFMLTGKKPYEANSSQETLQMHLQKAPPKLGKHFSEHTKEILNRMMAQKPEQRYQNWGELISKIKSILKRAAGSQTNVILKTNKVVKNEPKRRGTEPSVGKSKPTAKSKSKTNIHKTINSDKPANPKDMNKAETPQKNLSALIITLSVITVILIIVFIIVAISVIGT